MVIVHLGFDTSDAAFQREYPEFPFTIGGLRFSSDNPDAAEWLVKLSTFNREDLTGVPRRRRLFVVTEPQGHFPPDFINQFGILVSPFDVPGFDGIWHQSHGALPSFFRLELHQGRGRSIADYNELITEPIPAKRDAIAVVVSSKSILPGHRRRLRFVHRAAAALGQRIDVFGRGFREIADKATAILPYKYHLVLENSVMPAYWTEKVADAYLGHALPLVSGPPDLGRWFPAESFVPIDINQPDAAIATIERVMAGDLYAERVAAIAEARRRLMENERLCQVVARVIAAHPDTAPRRPRAETIRPAPKKPLLARLSREVARVFWQIESRLRR